MAQGLQQGFGVEEIHSHGSQIALFSGTRDVLGKLKIPYFRSQPVLLYLLQHIKKVVDCLSQSHPPELRGSHFLFAISAATVDSNASQLPILTILEVIGIFKLDCGFTFGQPECNF